jgi:soluble cytochrome b562
MQELKKVYKSIAAIPVKVEIQPVEHKSDSVLTVDELQKQIEEARKGKAKVDNQYVDYRNEAGHLFDYKFDYVRFLENISHIVKEQKAKK